MHANFHVLQYCRENLERIEGVAGMKRFLLQPVFVLQKYCIKLAIFIKHFQFKTQHESQVPSEH